MAHAEQIIRDLLDNIAVDQKLANYDLNLTPISSSGANYTSHLFTATLSDGRKVLNVFAKVAAIGEKMRTQLPITLYDNEMFFYTNLAKVYAQLEIKNRVLVKDRLKIPEYYGCSDKLYEETIVMENLSTAGYASFDRFKVVDWDYAASAVTELAKFHALSVAYQVEEPVVSQKVISDLKFDIPGDEEQMKPFWDQIVNQALEATKEENKKKLKDYFESNAFNRQAYIKLNEVGKLAVIAHGDYRPSNLMHRTRKVSNIRK